MYRLRDHVENHQTGGRPPGIFHPVQTVRRPVADVRPSSRAAAAFRVLGSDVGRLRDTEQRVQQTAAEKDLMRRSEPVSCLSGREFLSRQNYIFSFFVK